MYDTPIEQDLKIAVSRNRKINFKPKKNSKISNEDFEIITTLNKLNHEISSLHNCLNNITDPTLIDSYIYEIQAINMRYKYYLQICKARGLIANGPSFSGTVF